MNRWFCKWSAKRAAKLPHGAERKGLMAKRMPTWEAVKCNSEKNSGKNGETKLGNPCERAYHKAAAANCWVFNMFLVLFRRGGVHVEILNNDAHFQLSNSYNI